MHERQSHQHPPYPFSPREKVPGGRMRVRRNSDVQLQVFVPRPALATALRRTLTLTPLPMGEGL